MTEWWARYIGAAYPRWNCWGLVRRVYAEQLGISLPEYADIPPSDSRAVIRAMQAGAAGWADGDGSPFDVVLMRRHRLPLHVGVVTRLGWLLHTEKETDAVHTTMTHPSVAGRIIGFRRLPSSQQPSSVSMSGGYHGKVP